MSSSMLRARDSLAVTGRAFLGLVSVDRITRPHRKAPGKKEEENSGSGGSSSSNRSLTLQLQVWAAVLTT